VWAERERKGRWVVKNGRRQGALAQRMQAASSISLCLVWLVWRFGLGKERKRRTTRLRLVGGCRLYRCRLRGSRLRR
jgi:hypothetical protein